MQLPLSIDRPAAAGLLAGHRDRLRRGAIGREADGHQGTAPGTDDRFCERTLIELVSARRDGGALDLRRELRDHGSHLRARFGPSDLAAPMRPRGDILQDRLQRSRGQVRCCRTRDDLKVDHPLTARQVEKPHVSGVRCDLVPGGAGMEPSAADVEVVQLAAAARGVRVDHVFGNGAVDRFDAAGAHILGDLVAAPQRAHHKDRRDREADETDDGFDGRVLGRPRRKRDQGADDDGDCGERQFTFSEPARHAAEALALSIAQTSRRVLPQRTRREWAVVCERGCHGARSLSDPRGTVAPWRRVEKG